MSSFDPNIHVPGLWRCAKCSFVVVQSTFHAQTGTVSTRNDTGDRCPNDDAPLWHVTWREHAEAMAARCEEAIAEAAELRRTTPQPDALDARTVALTDDVLDEMIREHDGDGEFPSATAVYVKLRRDQMRLAAVVLLRATAPQHKDAAGVDETDDEQGDAEPETDPLRAHLEAMVARARQQEDWHLMPDGHAQDLVAAEAALRAAPRPASDDARDARRYRWLRSRLDDWKYPPPPGLFIVRVPVNMVVTEDFANAAVDAAIARQAADDAS